MEKKQAKVVSDEELKSVSGGNMLGDPAPGKGCEDCADEFDTTGVDSDSDSQDDAPADPR